MAVAPTVGRGQRPLPESGRRQAGNSSRQVPKTRFWTLLEELEHATLSGARARRDDDADVATSFPVQFSFYLVFIFDREYPVSEAVKEKGIIIFKGN